MIKIAITTLLNKVQNVEECDATKASFINYCPVHTSVLT